MAGSVRIFLGEKVCKNEALLWCTGSAEGIHSNDGGKVRGILLDLGN